MISSPRKWRVSREGRVWTHDELRSEATIEAHETFMVEHFTGTIETVLVQQLSDHGAPLVLHAISTPSLVTIKRVVGTWAQSRTESKFSNAYDQQKRLSLTVTQRLTFTRSMGYTIVAPNAPAIPYRWTVSNLGCGNHRRSAYLRGQSYTTN